MLHVFRPDPTIYSDFVWSMHTYKKRRANKRREKHQHLKSAWIVDCRCVDNVWHHYKQTSIIQFQYNRNHWAAVAASSSCIYNFYMRQKLKQLYMDIIEFFAAFFIALLSTLSFFFFLLFKCHLFFARSFSVDMQRWSKSDEERKKIHLAEFNYSSESLHDNTFF